MNSDIALIYFIPLLFGVFHGILFSTLLVVRGWRDDRLSDYFLAGLLVCGCLLVLPTMLGLLDIHVLWNEWLFLPIDPGLLIGPILFMFVQARTNGQFRFGKSQLIHAFPFAVYAIYHLIVFAQGKEAVFEWIDRVDLPYVDPVYQIATLVSMAAYLIVSIRHYRAYRQWLDTEYASADRYRYPWIIGILGAIGIAILATCFFRLFEVVRIDADYMQSWWTAAVVTASLYYVSIAGYVTPGGRQPVFVKREAREVEEATESSPFTEGELEGWMNSLADLMSNRRAYLNPDLGLGDLADELNVSRKVVSATINAGHGKNFRRYVNEYRVEAFKEAVVAGKAKEMTLYGLALDCGFNSKATFNRVFKQIEGVAPNEYVLAAASPGGDGRVSASSK